MDEGSFRNLTAAWFARARGSGERIGTVALGPLPPSTIAALTIGVH
jgi:hypothetical protein